MYLPGIEYRIEAVDGITEGGRLFLRGPNIMLGYINPKQPGSLIAPKDGWHDTGDIVTVDAEGFITIAGRAKRFAKIAGEMVSLTAVEGIAASIWPEVLHAALAQNCPRKGEQIVLYTEMVGADKATYVKKVQEQGYPELLVPQSIAAGVKIPVLPSGKLTMLV